eukprot:gene5760-11035_t
MSKELQRKHRQKYRREWEKESWARGWLSFSKKSVSKAYCCFCNQDFVAGKSELISHSKTTVCVSRAQQIRSNLAISDVFEVKSKDKMAAELNTVALIARRNISFNFLDHLLPTLHFIADDSRAIKDMTCNRTKGTYLLTECLSVDAHERLINAMKAAKGFSILCDKATDITKLFV